MTIRVVLSRGAARDIKRLVGGSDRARIFRSIEGLAEDQRPPNAKKLGGVAGVWRIRVGDWRICYGVEPSGPTLVVLTVARRGDVYERLRRRMT